MNTEPTFFGIAANRLVAFLGPHIAWVAGAVATWLMAQTNLFATFDVSSESLAGAISQALVFGVITLVVWLGQHKWLDGFQKWAYGIEQAIEHTPLPPQPVSPGSTHMTGMPPEAAQGFGAGEPPASE